MRQRGLWIFALASLIAACGSRSMLGAEVSPPNEDQKTFAMESTSGSLRILFNPSTSRIVRGSVYGLDAEIENISGKTINIDLSTVSLAVQPELEPIKGNCTSFYAARYNPAIDHEIVLQARDHFTVFFDIESPLKGREGVNCPSANLLTKIRKNLDFTPGNYAFVLTGVESIQQERHFFTETARLPVGIDQQQIMIDAGIGGLLAWLVTHFRRRNNFDLRSFAPWRKMAGAVLLSSTITIVASRLSTTQFPLKVSVEDFWGALTVGFVSFFVGGKFIDKLTGDVPATDA